MKKAGAIVICIICITALLIINSEHFNRSSFKNISPVSEEEPIITYDNNSTVIINSLLDNTFFKTTVISTSFLDDEGKIIWERPINTPNPTTSLDGNYLATGSELDGDTINIFNKEGFLFSLVIGNPIVDFSINKSGYVSVICENQEGYEVSVYSNEGIEVLKRVIYDEGIYPVTSELADDNEILAISMLNTNFLDLQTNLVFMKTSKTNEELSSTGEFAGKDISGQIVANIKFIDNKLITFSEEVIAIYKFENNDFILINEIIIDNYISEVKIINDKYIAVALGLNRNNISPYSLGTVIIYDINGEIICEKAGSEQITYMSSTTKGLIICNNRKVQYMDLYGNIVWEYINNRELNGVEYIGNSSLGILIEPSQIVKLRNGF
ncbi:MAG: DUF5711 family protein [Lachnospirales bacterium]